MSLTSRNGRHPTTIRPKPPVTTDVTVAAGPRARAASAGGDRRRRRRRASGAGGVAAAPRSGPGPGRLTPRAGRRRSGKSGGSRRRWARSGRWTSRCRFWTSSPAAPRSRAMRSKMCGRTSSPSAIGGAPIMLDRLRRVNTAKLSRRLEEVSIMIPGATLGEWRGALVARVGQRAKRLRTAIHKAGQIYAAEQLHSRPHRHQEAALRARAGRGLAAGGGAVRSSARSSARRRPSAACTICRSSNTMWPRCRRCHRRAAGRDDGGLDVIGADARGRVPAPSRAVHQAGPGAARPGRQRCATAVVPQVTRRRPLKMAAARSSRVPAARRA